MPLTILVVEDHARFRKVICSTLQERAEFEIAEAADGLEAVQRAEALQPDVILLDLNLPRMHGFEVAERVRSLAPGARVLFLSQESSPDIIERALSLGAHGYIHKVSAATDLLPAIDAALAGQRFVSRSVALTAPTVAPAPPCHEMLFCADDAAMVDGFARYVAGVLNAAGAAIVLVTKSHWTALLRELRRQGIGIDGAIERGTCVSFDADVAPDPARLLEAISGVREAAARAGNARARVAFCGERAGRLWAAGETAAAMQLEQIGDELSHDVDILCAYPARHANDEALMHICALHTAVYAG